jgi:hypothetical protein
MAESGTGAGTHVELILAAPNARHKWRGIITEVPRVDPQADADNVRRWVARRIAEHIKTEVEPRSSSG